MEHTFDGFFGQAPRSKVHSFPRSIFKSTRVCPFPQSLPPVFLILASTSCCAPPHALPPLPPPPTLAFSLFLCMWNNSPLSFHNFICLFHTSTPITTSSHQQQNQQCLPWHQYNQKAKSNRLLEVSVLISGDHRKRNFPRAAIKKAGTMLSNARSLISPAVSSPSNSISIRWEACPPRGGLGWASGCSGHPVAAIWVRSR